jgi:hypothetical protein
MLVAFCAAWRIRLWFGRDICGIHLALFLLIALLIKGGQYYSIVSITL